MQTPSDHWKQAEYMPYPAVETDLKVRCRPIKGDYQYPPFKSNQFGSRSSLLIPMLHLDQKDKWNPGNFQPAAAYLDTSRIERVSFRYVKNKGAAFSVI